MCVFMCERMYVLMYAGRVLQLGRPKGNAGVPSRCVCVCSREHAQTFECFNVCVLI